MLPPEELLRILAAQSQREFPSFASDFDTRSSHIPPAFVAQGMAGTQAQRVPISPLENVTDFGRGPSAPSQLQSVFSPSPQMASRGLLLPPPAATGSFKDLLLGLAEGPKQVGKGIGQALGGAAVGLGNAIAPRANPQAVPVPTPPRVGAFDGADFTSFQGNGQSVPSGTAIPFDAPAPGSQNPLTDEPEEDFLQYSPSNFEDQAVIEQRTQQQFQQLELLNLQDEIRRADAQRNIAEGFGSIRNTTTGDVLFDREGQQPFVDETSRRKIAELQKLQGDRRMMAHDHAMQQVKAQSIENQLLHKFLEDRRKEGKADAKDLLQMEDKKLTSIIDAVGSMPTAEVPGIAQSGIEIANKLKAGDELGGQAWGLLQGFVVRMIETGRLTDRDIPQFAGAKAIIRSINDWVATKATGAPTDVTLDHFIALFKTRSEDAKRQQLQLISNSLKSLSGSAFGEKLGPERVARIGKGALNRWGFPDNALDK